MLRLLLRRPEWLFALKGLGFYAAWYLAYDGLLHPAGHLDAWVAAGVAGAAGGALEGLGLAVHSAGRVVGIAGLPGVLVDDGCNGLTTLGLFAGFVVAYPGRAVRRAWFLPLGLAVITGANVVRVALLAYLQGTWPAGFDAIHTFGSTGFFYVVVFVLWAVWTRVGGADGPPRGAVERSGVLRPEAV